MVSFIAGKAVVSRQERPITLASFSRAASTNCCAGTSTPRSTTLKPLALSTLATMFLPMSWMSVCTVPRTTVPRVPVSAADWSRPSSASARLKISADMMSSERKYSPASYLSPIVFMPACRPVMMSAGGVPASCGGADGGEDVVLAHLDQGAGQGLGQLILLAWDGAASAGDCG